MADSLFDACACAGKCLCTFFTELNLNASTSKAFGPVQHCATEVPVRKRLTRRVPETGSATNGARTPNDHRTKSALARVPAKLVAEGVRKEIAIALPPSSFPYREPRT